MSAATCPTCGSTAEIDIGDGWETPSANGAVTNDGERYRIRWWVPGRDRVRKIALFRVVTDDRTAVLQHIRTLRISQRVEERISDLDPSPELDDVPAEWRLLMRADGFTPAVEGDV